MVLFSAVYVAFALALYRAGAGDAALVYANIGNLAVRIAYCTRFAVRFFRTAPPPAAQLRLRSVLPPMPYVLALGGARALIALSARRTRAVAVAGAQGRGVLLDMRVLLHIGVGGVLAVACAGVWWWAAGRSLVRRAREEKAEKDE